MCRRITCEESLHRHVSAVSRAARKIFFILPPLNAAFVLTAACFLFAFPFYRRMSENDDIEVDSDADKRAHHNALERKRRDHIKDSFHGLRDSVPALQGEKSSVKQASRAQILDKATEYIQYMRRKNHSHQQDIDDLKKQNALLEQQVRALEKAKGNNQLQTNYSSDSSLYTNRKGSAVSAFDGGSDSSSESEPEEPPTRKRLRVEPS
ncbi:protein max-like isoform X1 [Phyllopteryx taeniolatus]|uniref:protein max-like isoform X1 n=1 Tax=Phyllopteryx taeniolatus TaxID=161469 RepID=UPI002AD467BA|nr:protein max-like isoform X1 [Phyllopteryx taeniolatus]